MKVKRTKLLLPTIIAASCLACIRPLDSFELDGGSTSADTGGSTTDGGTSVDTGTPGVTVVPADIIFVVDNSCSMLDEQRNLAFNFGSFVGQTIGAAEYRMGIITSDLTSPSGEMGGLAEFSYASAYPNELSDVNLSGCAPVGIEHGCFRGPVIDSTTMDRETQIQNFADTIEVGTCGTGTETGLEAVLRALEQTAPGGCNEGFLRSEANLLLVFVSDEDDGSAMPVDVIAAALGQFKPYGQIRVATINGSINGEPSACAVGFGAGCGTLCNDTPPTGSMQPCSPSCPGNEVCGTGGTCEHLANRYWEQCSSCSFFASADCCSALPGARYVDFAREMELRVNVARPDFPVAQCRGSGSRVACLTDTICQTNFGDTLARIARELVVNP